MENTTTDEFLSHYINDISTSLLERIGTAFSYFVQTILSLLLFGVIWVLSYILYWLVGLVLVKLCHSNLNRNDKRYRLKNSTHKKLTLLKFPRLADVRGLTYNRVYFFQLIISWTAFWFMCVGIFILEHAYLIILLSPLVNVFGFFVYRGTFSERVVSFFSRLYVLYYDLARIGSYVYIKRPNSNSATHNIIEKYKIRDFTIFDVVLECIEKRKSDIQAFSIITHNDNDTYNDNSAKVGNDHLTTTERESEEDGSSGDKYTLIPIQWLCGGIYPVDIYCVY